jgi:hypothetical protein
LWPSQSPKKFFLFISKEQTLEFLPYNLHSLLQKYQQGILLPSPQGVTKKYSALEEKKAAQKTYKIMQQ